MNNRLVKINNTDLLVKEFNGQRVVTFKDIDMLHGRVEGTAKRNFNENKKHLIKDVDYFLIKQSNFLKDEIRALEIPNRGITFLTESGYLMLVKSFQDDLAWEVQRELVNNYFRVKSNFNNQLPSIELGNQMLNLAQGTQMMAQVVKGMLGTVNNLQVFVQDSIQAKDKQIDDMAEMIGLRSRNVKHLIDKLKETIKLKYEMDIVNSSMPIYQKAKNKIFAEFGVYKWEDIPIGKYNQAYAFIETMFE